MSLWLCHKDDTKGMYNLIIQLKELHSWKLININLIDALRNQFDQSDLMQPVESSQCTH